MWPKAVGVLLLTSFTSACNPSVTTVSGTHATHNFCSGSLIFSEDFNEFDLEKWQHENTLAGSLNWEFQYFNNNRSNSFAQCGKLHIRPTLTSDQYGEDFLYSGTLNVEGSVPASRCTNPQSSGCERSGSERKILNPIKSASIYTVNSFSFRYGRVEVRAKLPAGDWLRPTVCLRPAFNAYGTTPASGEIYLIEARGNRNLSYYGEHIGTKRVGATLHYGPHREMNGWRRTHWEKKNPNGYNSDFHRYQLEWTPDFLKISIDDVEIGRTAPSNGGFWAYGKFDQYPWIGNPWRSASKMAPFDQKFYLNINLAVGGTGGFFPDGPSKPWSDSSQEPMTEFWKARDLWEPTWNLDKNGGEDASLQIDYVRVWAL